MGQGRFHCYETFHQWEMQFHSNNQCPPVVGKPKIVTPPPTHLQFAKLYTKGVMFWPRGGRLVYSSTNLHNLSVIFLSFFHNTSYMIWTTLSFNYRYFSNACTYPIDLMGIHLLHCSHGNERTRTHDVICNIFATIVQDVNFHMGQKQLHFLQPHSIPLVDELILCSPQMTFTS